MNRILRAAFALTAVVLPPSVFLRSFDRTLDRALARGLTFSPGEL